MNGSKKGGYMMKQKQFKVYSEVLDRTYYGWTYEELLEDVTTVMILMGNRNRFFRQYKKETDPHKKEVQYRLYLNALHDLKEIEDKLKSPY